MALDGKVAIVTGGARGIGGACVDALTAAGARVMIADILSAEAKARVATLGVHRTQFVRTDVTKSAEVEVCVARTIDAFGRLDIIVNNAGTFVYKLMHEYTEAEWDMVLGVNLKSIFLTGKYGIPHMVANGGGAIVNIASVHAERTATKVASYAASKAGVVGLTRGMALDYGPHGIRVNAVLPGAVDTPLSRRNAIEAGVAEDQIEVEWLKLHPIGFFGMPPDIARVVVFLCSDDARFMTGSAVTVDGGLLAGF